MTMLWLIIVCILIVACSWALIVSRRTGKHMEVESLMYPQAPTVERKGGQLENLSVRNLTIEKRWLVTIPFAIAVGIFVGGRGGNFFFGAILGGAVPWVVMTEMRRNYERSFREGGKKSIEFLGAVLAAGGSLEDWVGEVIPRLDGPIKVIFQRGYKNLKEGLPIKVLLERLIKSSPDSYLQLVFSALLNEYNQSGDMPKLVDEVLGDMINQEKFERAMSLHRRSGQQMLIYIICFPVFLYLLFYAVVNNVMHLHPWTIAVFVAGIAGYVGFLWIGLRITRNKLF